MFVPGLDIDAARIESAAGELGRLARTSLDRAETVGLNWKALRGPYQAPETPDLLTFPDDVVAPHATETRTVSDLVTTALETFAQEARPLVEQLRSLAAQPESPEAQAEIQALVRLLTTREIECADAIRSAIGPSQGGLNLTVGDAVEIIGGGLLIAGGGLGEVGGAGLDATGVGLPAGIALGAASAAGIVLGRRVIARAAERILLRSSAEKLGAAEELSAVGGGAGAVRIGQAGEAAVRAVYDIGPKATDTVAGRTRIFDGLTRTTVSEVKNVRVQAYTQQLKDSLQYAKDTGRQFHLYVRKGAHLTAPLLKAVEENKGVFDLRLIP
ncbi:MAG TPA: putative toxin [Lapillicoccus sp.]